MKQNTKTVRRSLGVDRSNIERIFMITSFSLVHLHYLLFLATACVVMPLKSCDISGLDKVAVVRALWKASLVAHNAKIFTPDLAAKTDLPDADIREALSRGYINYLNCRLIRADFSGNSFSTDSYNRDNGYGAAEEVIAALRKS